MDIVESVKLKSLVWHHLYVSVMLEDSFSESTCITKQ